MFEVGEEKNLKRHVCFMAEYVPWGLPHRRTVDYLGPFLRMVK